MDHDDDKDCRSRAPLHDGMGNNAPLWPKLHTEYIKAPSNLHIGVL
jgi:hypothetical protein